jgi:hypothetical protein
MIELSRIHPNPKARVYEVLEKCENASFGVPIGIDGTSLITGMPHRIGVAIAQNRRVPDWKLIPQARVKETVEAVREIKRYHLGALEGLRNKNDIDFVSLAVGEVRNDMDIAIWEAFLKVAKLHFNAAVRRPMQGAIMKLSRDQYPELYASGFQMAEGFRQGISLSSR